MHDERWRVLILSAGYGREMLRATVDEHLKSLGFASVVYDRPGYIVDPLMHSHAACVRMVPQADIVLAFADEKLGGEYCIEESPNDIREALSKAGILARITGKGHGVSITQVEVSVAKSLAKPTIVFIPLEVQAAAHTILGLLSKGAISVKPRPGVTIAPDDLIRNHEWGSLNEQFIIPSAHIETFGQLCFLESLTKDKPNFVEFYDRNNLADLRNRITSRLRGVVSVLVRKHGRAVNGRIEKSRSPLSAFSLEDLHRRGLIIPPPARAVSGPEITGAVWDEVANSLKERKSVLLIGNPGLGKTTVTLFAFRALESLSAGSLDPVEPMYAHWLELDTLPPDGDNLIRKLLGQTEHREPWPGSLALPGLEFAFVLDGLDEATVDRTKATEFVLHLGAQHALLVSCRRIDYERWFTAVGAAFPRILELQPWSEREIAAYVKALEDAGVRKGAALIRKWRQSGAGPDVLSVPLWLSMIAFVGEREYQDAADVRSFGAMSEYDLISECSLETARRELARHKAQTNPDALFQIWGEIAWAVHEARREHLQLSQASLSASIASARDPAAFAAATALLHVSNKYVRGFFHEVFQEFWLAWYLKERILQENSAERLTAALAYQRSVVTNRFLRLGLAKGAIDTIAARLREAFWHTETVGNRGTFVKNQLVYLLGRIDRDSSATRQFLLFVWRSAENPVVRHSAAFALIMGGDSVVERDFYSVLTSSLENDEINRGYHLYYYGDIDIREQDVPFRDQGTQPAARTLNQLVSRLQKREERHLRLRRIELFTIRRLLETGRATAAKAELVSAVGSILSEHKQSTDTEVSASICNECERILSLIQPGVSL